MNPLVRFNGMARIAVRQRMQYRFDFIMTFAASFMFSMMYFMLWKAIYANSSDPVMPWQQLITYIMVGQAINFARWSPAERGPVYGTAYRIQSGDIALDLIRPIGFQKQRFIEAFGFFVVEMMWVNIPLLIILVAMFGISPPADLFAGVSFVFSLFIGFLTAFSLNSIVMMISFWTMNAQGVQIAKKAMVDLLAGTLVPYEFFPLWLQKVVLYLPFQGMAYIPLSIYTGSISGSSISVSLVQQLFWAFIMLGISRLLWLKASKQITIYGG